MSICHTPFAPISVGEADDWYNLRCESYGNLKIIRCPSGLLSRMRGGVQARCDWKRRESLFGHVAKSNILGRSAEGLIR